MSDDHFQQMLAPAMRPVSSTATGEKLPFIASKTFTNKRDGYYFTKGNSGLGYYFDTRYSFKRKASEPLEDESSIEQLASARKSKAAASSSSIAKLLEQADATDIVPLDAASLKQLLMALDKKIIHNQKMRAKYFDEPDKFMDSEIELNNAIGELNMVAASPELYNIFISTTGMNAVSTASSGDGSNSVSGSQMTKRNGLLSLINLITHENTDISLSVLSLLAEMIDSEILLLDNNTDDEDDGDGILKESKLFLEAFISPSYQAFELLVQNLTRLDIDSSMTTATSASSHATSSSSSSSAVQVVEENEQDAQGVYNTLSIIENLINVYPSGLVDTICSRTNLLTYLITTIKKKKIYDMNKLYCTEILSILLQSSTNSQNAKKLCSLKINEYGGDSPSTSLTDGMDILLQCIAFYRKREPISSDEQECIHNLFLSLCALLMVPAHQELFRQCEGVDLMIRCLKEQKYAALCAPKAINYALTNNTRNCHAFITAGGLKYVFPIFMHRGLPRPRSLASGTVAGNKSSSSSSNHNKANFIKTSDVKEAEEENVSVICQLCLHINHHINANYRMISIKKENNHDDDDDEVIFKDNYQRLLIKFMENDYEKLSQAVDLFVVAYKRLNAIDYEIRTTIQTLKQNIYAIGNSGITDENEDEIEAMREQLDEYSSDDNIQELRMQGGLSTLQQLSVIILFVCLHSPTPVPPATTASSRQKEAIIPTMIRISPALEKVLSLLTSYQLSLQVIVEFAEDRIEGLEKEILSIEGEKEVVEAEQEIEGNEMKIERTVEGEDEEIEYDGKNIRKKETLKRVNNNTNTHGSSSNSSSRILNDLTDLEGEKTKEKSVLINWLVSLSQLVEAAEG